MTQFTDKDTSNVTRPKTNGNSEAIKVIVRCRPLSEVEIKEGHQSIISIDTNRGVIEIKNPKDSNETSKNFTFDAIYDWSSTQSELYDETFRDLVNSVLNGFNGTIFAYGQTGTGKTFTMEGNYNDKDLRGVIPNSFEHIFQHISNSTQQQYLVRASYLEIYQEEIRDLLNKDSTIRLELKERPDIGVYVKDLSSFVVKSVQEIHNVMSVGHANRSVGRTNMNEHSSRSHAIFMITIECSEVGPDGENHIRVGRLNLVDLAGSERQSKTGTLGERFKEATKINLSLSALGNVISALVDGKSSHIPYRDSKLTRLLQDSLGGNSKTIMVANIGPASYNYEETIGTLRYANRAKNIKNKPRINEDPKDALVREFQEEIARLKSMLEKRGLSSSRKRRNKKYNIMSDSTESNTTNQSNTLEYLEEQQRILENKQKEIYDSTSIISEEKQKLLEDLNIRKQELVKEREAQQNLADRIQAIQSKLLSGNSNLFDKTRKQENELESKRLEIAEQRKREREILQQLESQEFSTSEISQTFTTLKQEVELKTKKLKKLYLKYQQIRSELQDISFHHSRERQDLETSVSEITKELKLKLLIVDNFIPSDVVKKLKERAYFDDDADEWHILKSGHARPKTSDTLNDSRLFNTSLNLEDEKSSTFIHQDDTILSNKKSDSEISIGNFMQTLVLRPSSRPEQRRSFTIYEQQLLNKARQRIQKSSCVKPTLFANEDNLVEEIIPEEVIRFCGENIITFSCLETFPSIVKNYDIVSLSQSNKMTLLNTKKPSFENTISSNCDVMIDVSRIPAPRRAISRDSRKEHKNNSKLHSSISIPKKEDARSVPYSLQHTTAMANISPNTNALVYPRARGLIPIPNKR
uniref:Kinesin-like protein n=1 Tax=Strongyloides venezuelensis TaxID=75913 RepID=A0A0K0FJ41_STRVS